MSEVIEAALTYAARGWRIIPVSPTTKRPCFETGTGHGAASLEPDQIKRWFATEYPRAVAAVVTGAQSGIAVIDVDIRATGSGLDTLEERYGITTNPMTPTAHSPHGLHWYFRHPGGYVKSAVGEKGLGKLVDIRADGAFIIVPPRPGAFWDPHLGLDQVPLADWPAWAVVPEPKAPELSRRHDSRPHHGALTAYASAALESAVARIVEAGPGAQEVTLNAEAFGLGRLAGGGVVPAGLALDSLLWAGRRLPSYDARRPWRPTEIERKVKAAFTDGLRQPRTVAHGR